jgi:hypothetical protein
MVRKVLAVLAASATVVVALPAIADSGRLTDPRGDVRTSAPPPRSDYDITWVAWGHDRGGYFNTIHVVGTIGHIRTGMGALPAVDLKVPNVNSGNPNCDFILQEVPPNVGANTTDHWKYFVETCANGAPQQTVGRVSASRLSAHRIKLVFWPKAIGNPGRYNWAVEMPIETDTPPADRAPNSGFEVHIVG